MSDILLDTGCTRTMVRGDLVPEENLLPGEAATVLCAHGNTVLYPLARVRIDVEGYGSEGSSVRIPTRVSPVGDRCTRVGPAPTLQPSGGTHEWHGSCPGHYTGPVETRLGE